MASSPSLGVEAGDWPGGKHTKEHAWPSLGWSDRHDRYCCCHGFFPTPPSLLFHHPLFPAPSLLRGRCFLSSRSISRKGLSSCPHLCARTAPEASTQPHSMEQSVNYTGAGVTASLELFREKPYLRRGTEWTGLPRATASDRKCLGTLGRWPRHLLPCGPWPPCPCPGSPSPRVGRRPRNQDTLTASPAPMTPI